MAEYSKLATKQVASIFLEQYNLENGTKFSWEDDKSYQFKEPYDFTLFDGKKQLGIQLIRAVADPEREFIRPGRSGRVIEPLRKKLEEANLPGISVYLNFRNPPQTKDQVAEAIYWLDFFITEKVSRSLGLVYFEYDESFDKQFLPNITKYISDIRISPLKRLEGYVSITFGWSKESPEPWLDDEQRVSIAAKKKAGKYNDVILLIDSGHSPIFDFYIPLIKDSLSKMNLNEVWIVDNFSINSRAFRAK